MPVLGHTLLAAWPAQLKADLEDTFLVAWLAQPMAGISGNVDVAIHKRIAMFARLRPDIAAGISPP